MAGEDRPEVWWDDERTAQWAVEQGLCVSCHHPPHGGRCGAFLHLYVPYAERGCPCGERRRGTVPWTRRHPMPGRAGGRGGTQPPRAAGATHDFRSAAPEDIEEGGGARQRPSLDLLVLRCCLHAAVWSFTAPGLFPGYIRTHVDGALFGVWFASVSWALDRWLPYDDLKAAYRRARRTATGWLPQKEKRP